MGLGLYEIGRDQEIALMCSHYRILVGVVCGKVVSGPQVHDLFRITRVLNKESRKKAGMRSVDKPRARKERPDRIRVRSSDPFDHDWPKVHRKHREITDARDDFLLLIVVEVRDLFDANQ